MSTRFRNWLKEPATTCIDDDIVEPLAWVLHCHVQIERNVPFVRLKKVNSTMAKAHLVKTSNSHCLHYAVMQLNRLNRLENPIETPKFNKLNLYCKRNTLNFAIQLHGLTYRWKNIFSCVCNVHLCIVRTEIEFNFVCSGWKWSIRGSIELNYDVQIGIWSEATEGGMGQLERGQRVGGGVR